MLHTTIYVILILLFLFAEAYRNNANVNAIANLGISQSKLTHADVGFAYVVVTKEERELGAMPEKDDVRKKIKQQIYMQPGSKWSDFAPNIGKYAAECFVNRVKDKDLMCANVFKINPQ